MSRKSMRTINSVVAFFALLGLVRIASAAPQKRMIDTARSKITVRVYKSGLFSPFAHDHEVEALIEWGELNDSDSPSVELRVNASKLHVLDPGVSEDERAKVQTTMQGPEVLDSARYSEIHFQSTAVEPSGTDHWIVHGNLDLHGKTNPVSVDVTFRDDLYRGTALLKQTQFGITPIKIAGGTVKVKDEIKIEFVVSVVKP